MTSRPSPVKELALGRLIPVLQPFTLKTAEARSALFERSLDVLVVAAYGLILPPPVLEWPRFGCINVHASRLPRWRGAAPIQRAIEAGDTTTGVTIMQMDAGLDTGPMIATIDVEIAPRETARTLHDKLAAIGAAAIVDVLQRLGRGESLVAIPQPDGGATYATKLHRAEAVIDWTKPALVIDRAIRAFDPVPGASTSLNGETFKVWAAQVRPIASVVPPGTVVALMPDGIDVGCGEHVLQLTTVQPAGGKRMPAAAFAAGRSIGAGTRFGADVG